MITSLLSTKLYFPSIQRKLVPRARLLTRLEAGLQGPLTLLSAPAGSGKTTLLSEWRLGPGKDVPVAWISLDEGDNDPARFFHHLIASFDSLQPGILPNLLPLLQSSENLLPETVLIPLINLLSSRQDDFILALDDYHVIGTTAIHAALGFLLDHLPSHLHLVLLTRADPPLPLARLRARGQLTEIRAEHLHFRTEEAACFLNEIMGLGLTTDQVTALEARTEGWIAGLQLAGLSMQGREDLDGFISAFTGSHHYIVDYLAEEVLARQVEPLRDFLLKTSIVERLSGPLCDAITQGVGGNELLEDLEHANLFVIPLDDNHTWYRYHQLFADLLRSRLLHSHPEEFPQLHSRASAWYEINGMPDEAIDHALQAHDFERAARLFCLDRLQVIYTHSISRLDCWLDAFPETILLADPWLCIAKAHVNWSNGRRDQLEPYVTAAQESLSRQIASGKISEGSLEARIVQGEIYTFRSLMEAAQENYQAAVALARQALEIIPADARHRVFALGSLYMVYQMSGDIDLGIVAATQAIAAARALNYPSMHSTAAYSLALLLRIEGKLQRSRQILLEALTFAERQNQSRLFYHGLLHIGLAETLYEWNRLDEMGSEVDIGMELLEQGGRSVILQIGLSDRALLEQARGDLASTLRTLAEIESLGRDMDPRTYRDGCRLFRLRLQAGQGDLTGLAEVVEATDLNVPEKMGTGRFADLFYAAEFLVDLGRLDEAVSLLERMDAALEKNGNAGWRILVLALEAVVWQKRNEASHALEALEQALALAQPEDSQRAFLNLGEPMHDLLRLNQARTDESAFAMRLLAAFSPPPPSPANASPVGSLARLSKRETELLGLIAAGCSNKEIAAQLVISVGTVKRHVINIFNKLDVKNRTEAVARGRELGLL